MRKKILILPVVLGPMLTACLANDPNVGSGPIALSPGSQKNFEAYLEKRAPGFFAVAEDGAGSYFDYCSAGRCYRESSNTAIYNCEKNNIGKTCKIYASKGKIVWKKDVETAEN